MPLPGETYIFYGEDEPSVSEAVQGVKQALGPTEEVLSNTTSFDGKTLTPGQLEMACNTVPFMSGYRLIVVSGFLERFEDRQPGPRARPARAQKAASDGSAKATKEDEWARLGPMLKAMPPSTVLVFASGKVGARNPVLAAIKDGAQVRLFPMLKGPELQDWIRGRVATLDGRITLGAIRLLENFTGDDLRLLDNELRKLCTYAGPLVVDEKMVQAMTNDTRQANIFELVDGMMQGRHTYVLRTLRQLMDQPGGAAGPYVITMLARQSRMLLIAKSVRESGGTPDDLPTALGTTSDFVVRKVIDQARPYSTDQLGRLHQRLLAADISIKDGTSPSDELALETLVLDAAAILNSGK